MINFKQFLLNETVFNIIDRLCDSPQEYAKQLTALWVFYKTNQKAKGIVALHRFYENDDDLTEKIFVAVAEKMPIETQKAREEIRQFVSQSKIHTLRQTLRQYFLAKEDDKDILPQMKQGPRLPSKPVTTSIKPKSRSFG